MINEIVRIINQKFPVKEIDTGKYKKFKASPLSVTTKQFKADGLGWIACLEGSAMFGLMKMVTIVIHSDERDIPLMSYDYISAMGNHTLLVEYYDTTKDRNQLDLSEMEKIKASLTNMKEYDLGEHWYDSMKLSCSIAKRDKKNKLPQMNQAVLASVKAYCQLAEKMPLLKDGDITEKQKRTAKYVDGLFEHGGPSTDAFVKAIGKEAAYDFFTKIIFKTV